MKRILILSIMAFSIAMLMLSCSEGVFDVPEGENISSSKINEIYGYVWDYQTPLDATLTLQKEYPPGQMTRTDEDGYYEFLNPVWKTQYTLICDPDDPSYGTKREEFFYWGGEKMVNFIY